MAGLFASDQGSFDPAVSSLFASSLGPVAAPEPQKREEAEEKSSSENDQDAADESNAPTTDDESVEEPLEVAPSSENLQRLLPDGGQEQIVFSEEARAAPAPPRKRKHKDQHEDLEAAYLGRLVKEEEQDQQRIRQERKAKRQRLENDDAASSNKETEAQNEDLPPEASNDGSDAERGLSPPPMHESLTQSRTETEMDKAARTVFLSNVSTTAITSKSARKQLLTHLASHFGPSASSNPAPKIESLRFRSTAFDTALPKKAAFTRGDIKEATTHSTNAYCVYSTKVAAREAAKILNGSIVLGRHLRVDEVAHPMKVDHRRCVFVGNLGFVDDETEMKASLSSSQHPEDQKKAQSKPLKGDAEEGLWQQFNKAGVVESVRVVRDPKTRVGKGFGYVQFKDENGVESALLFDGKKFPPLLPRKLRVTRCKKPSVTKLAAERNQKREQDSKKQTNREDGDRRNMKKPRMSLSTADDPAQQGRLKKMLGRAGLAEIRAETKLGHPLRKPVGTPNARPLVFEGQRASSAQGNQGLKLGGAKKKSKGQASKRQQRSNERAAAYKNKKTK